VTFKGHFSYTFTASVSWQQMSPTKLYLQRSKVIRGRLFSTIASRGVSHIGRFDKCKAYIWALVRDAHDSVGTFYWTNLHIINNLIASGKSDTNVQATKPKAVHLMVSWFNRTRNDTGVVAYSVGYGAKIKVREESSHKGGATKRRPWLYSNVKNIQSLSHRQFCYD